MKLHKFLMIIALVAIMFSVTGCVTTSSIGGTNEDHGWLSGLFIASSKKAAGSKEVASYYILFGLIDIGYSDYSEKVKAAEAKRLQISSVSNTILGIWSTTTAYTK